MHTVYYSDTAPAIALFYPVEGFSEIFLAPLSPLGRVVQTFAVQYYGLCKCVYLLLLLIHSPSLSLPPSFCISGTFISSLAPFN